MNGEFSENVPKKKAPSRQTCWCGICGEGVQRRYMPKHSNRKHNGAKIDCVERDEAERLQREWLGRKKVNVRKAEKREREVSSFKVAEDAVPGCSFGAHNNLQKNIKVSKGKSN